LASIALGDLYFWGCDVFGSIIALVAALNLTRACGKDKSGDAPTSVNAS